MRKILCITAVLILVSIANSNTPVVKLNANLLNEIPLKLPSSYELITINPGPIEQTLDTLVNTYGGSPYYYFSNPQRFRMARLTPIAPCTLKTILIAKQRGLLYGNTNPCVAGCSLLIYSDNNAYPGTILYLGYARDSLPAGVGAAWFVYDVSSLNIRLGVEDFWAGCRYVKIYDTDTLFHLCGQSVSGPDRNVWGLYSTGPWNYASFDYCIAAIVKREENVQVHDIQVRAVDNSQGYFLPNPGNAALSCIIHNNGTEPEQNFAVVCTVYNDAGEDVFNSSYTVTSELLPDSVLEVVFTPNWTPNVEGIYYIVVRSLLPGDARPANDVRMREAQVCGSPAELRYDDGEMDNAYAFYNEGNGYANKFTLPYSPA
ncbi:MAG: hypothetical protein NZ601_02620, partial [candidate division WOR-3 bacterium]|nr:hypothetical protein [candidate division WOR-3 bacterium]MDW7987887.1 hypothetical protein [candidate division WOR-3 bacterium]